MSRVHSIKTPRNFNKKTYLFQTNNTEELIIGEMNISKDKDCCPDLKIHPIIPKIGYNLIFKEKLGCGSYGDVYRCIDENDKEFAVKCCKSTQLGIPNLLETSIMSSIYHPNLNRALRIYATSDILYICQDMAIMDLTKVAKNQKTPTMTKIWCHSIAQGVACLHRQGIIHSDIKANNVLLYRDGSVRLSDFTLSVKKLYGTDKFNHTVCTSTHRPLECYLRQTWNESLDIWSLACTFYEITFSSPLFPYQGNIEKSSDDKKGWKLRLKQRAINCLIDWKNNGPILNTFLPNLDYFPLKYHSFHLDPDFDSPDHLNFRALILGMLRTDPLDRLNIIQILNDKYFEHLPRFSYNIILSHPLDKNIPSLSSSLERYVARYSDDDRILIISSKLLRCIATFRNLSDHIKAAVCVFIVSKIINGKVCDLNIPMHQIFAGERIICEYLNFRLHEIINLRSSIDQINGVF